MRPFHSFYFCLCFTTQKYHRPVAVRRGETDNNEVDYDKSCRLEPGRVFIKLK